MLCKLAVSTDGKERPKKEADRSRLEAGLISKTSRLLHLLTGILKVYIEALPGFSHVFSLEGLSKTLLSQGSILAMAARIGIMSRTCISSIGEE